MRTGEGKGGGKEMGRKERGGESSYFLNR